MTSPNLLFALMMTLSFRSCIEWPQKPTATPASAGLEKGYAPDGEAAMGGALSRTDLTPETCKAAPGMNDPLALLEDMLGNGKTFVWPLNRKIADMYIRKDLPYSAGLTVEEGLELSFNLYPALCLGKDLGDGDCLGWYGSFSLQGKSASSILYLLSSEKPFRLAPLEQPWIPHYEVIPTPDAWHVFVALIENGGAATGSYRGSLIWFAIPRDHPELRLVRIWDRAFVDHHIYANGHEFANLGLQILDDGNRHQLRIVRWAGEQDWAETDAQERLERRQESPRRIPFVLEFLDNASQLRVPTLEDKDYEFRVGLVAWEETMPLDVPPEGKPLLFSDNQILELPKDHPLHFVTVLEGHHPDEYDDTGADEDAPEPPEDFIGVVWTVQNSESAPVPTLCRPLNSPSLFSTLEYDPGHCPSCPFDKFQMEEKEKRAKKRSRKR